MGRIKNNKNRRKEPNDTVNEAIRFPTVLVIGPEGQQLGQMSRDEALETAYDMDLDLLLVSANSEVPVCKILDYGKYKFDEQKKAQAAKKNQQTSEIKALRVSPVIDQHDFDTKVSKAREWLENNQKVRIDMRFRGRMITRQEVGREVIAKFTEQVSDIADISKEPKMEGNTLSVMYSPKKGGKQGGKNNESKSEETQKQDQDEDKEDVREEV